MISPSDKYIDSRVKRSQKKKEKRSRKESRRHRSDRSRHLDDDSKSSHTSPSSSRETSPVRLKSPLPSATSALVQSSSDEQSLSFSYDGDDVMSYAVSKYVLSSSKTLDDDNSLTENNKIPYRDDPEDPLASTFMDEYDGDLEDVDMKSEIQNNFTGLGDSEKSQRRSHCRRYCLVLVCVVFAAGIVGLVVLLMDHGGDKSKQAANDHFVNPVNTKSPISVPLDDATNDATNDATDELTERSPTISPVSSEENVSAFPATNFEVASACASSTLQDQGPSQCFLHCSVAECCWKTGVEICHHSQCSSIARYCFKLNDYIDPSDSGGTIKTSPTPTAVPTPFPTATHSLNMDESTSSSSVSIPFAPSILPSLCSAVGDSNNVVETELCVEACAKAECCWKSGATKCASSVPVVECQDYTDACSILNSLTTTPMVAPTPLPTPIPSPFPTVAYSFGIDPSTSSSSVSIPTAPSNLSTLCAAVGGSGDVGLVELCMESCATALCCWKTGLTNCASSVPNNEQCHDYFTACSVLNVHF